MEATGDHHLRQIKPVSEGQIYVFSHLRFLNTMYVHKIICEYLT